MEEDKSYLETNIRPNVKELDLDLLK